MTRVFVPQEAQIRREFVVPQPPEELTPASAPEQLDMFVDRADLERQRRLDAAVDRLRGRYGLDAVQRGAVFADPAMAVPPAQEEFSFVRKLG